MVQHNKLSKVKSIAVQHCSNWQSISTASSKLQTAPCHNATTQILPEENTIFSL